MRRWLGSMTGHGDVGVWMMRDPWTDLRPPDEYDAERADIARLLGYEPSLGKPPQEHCPTHGDYTPLDLLQPECHWCLAEMDDAHSRRGWWLLGTRND